MKPSYIKNAFRKTINSMTEDLSRFVKRPGIDFSRNRKCSFEELLLFILSMETSTLNREIRRFFKKPASLMTKSAIIQQRKKLNEDAFPFLFSEINRLFPLQKTFLGYHLMACDGSDINIPFLKSDLSTHVSSNTKGVLYDQEHLNAVYDLLEQRYWDILIQPRAELNEGKALLSILHRNNIPERSIFIADRGYFSLNLLANFLLSRHHFLLRMKEGGFLSRFTLPDKEEFDISLEITATRSKKKEFLEDPEHYVILRPDRPFDFIAPDDRTSQVKLSFRLVKVALPNGKSEYLITDLPTENFSSDVLEKLYKLRWGIETSFRVLKYNVALNHFHSIRRDFISQEIYAKVILYNFSMLIVHCVQSSSEINVLNRRIAISDAVPICRDFLIQKIKNAEIRDLLVRFMTDIRPDRSFPRKVRSKRNVPLSYRA